jgi:hypothetical protein
VASLTAVVMYLRFPHLRKKSYFTLQFYVAVSNVLTSIGSAIGVVETGTVACWSQGILTNVFTLSSIQWTTVMAFSLYSIVHYEKQVEVTPLVHAYCWLPPILASVLPLINSTYGNVGNWCWVVDTKHTPPWGGMFWFWFSFYGWVWLGFFLMAGILANIHFTIQQKKATFTVQSLRKIVSTLNLFPLMILIAWGPACVSDTIWQMFDRYNSPFGVVGTICACSQGLLTSILFWTRNKEVRKLTPLFFKLDAPISSEQRELRSDMRSTLSSSDLNSQSSNSDGFWSSINSQLNYLRPRLKLDVSLRAGAEIDHMISTSSNPSATATNPVNVRCSFAELRSSFSSSVQRSSSHQIPQLPLSLPMSPPLKEEPQPSAAGASEAVTRDEEQCSDLIESFHPEEKHGKHVRQLLMQESFE